MAPAEHELLLRGHDLASLALFGGLTAEVLDFLAGNLELHHFDDGDVVFEEGDTGRDLYVVMSGSVEIWRRRGQTSEQVATLTPGTWFGEGSVLAVQPRSATVRVSLPCTLLRISARNLNDLYRHDVRAYALLVLNMARDLSRQLRLLRQALFDGT